MTQRLPADEESVVLAADALKRGEAVAYPTETQYGLGVDALNSAATAELVAIKGRESGTFLLIVDRFEAAADLSIEMAEPARLVAGTCWPGPVTLLLPARPGLPPEVVGDDGLVAVRISSHPVSMRLPALAGVPVVSSSANLSGLDPITDPDEIEKTFGDRLSVILDAGKLPPGPPSTIVDARKVPLKVVREGAVSRNSLARRTGLDVEGGQAIPLVLFVCTGNTCRSPLAEGAMKMLLRRRGLEGRVDVASAGVAAVNWGKAIEESQVVAWEEGIDISAHMPRQLTPQMTQEADILIAMHEQHRNRVALIDPEAREKTHMLKKLTAELRGRTVAGTRNIEDPIGRPMSFYRRILRSILNELEGGLDLIVDRVTEHRARVTQGVSNSGDTGDSER